MEPGGLKDSGRKMGHGEIKCHCVDDRAVCLVYRAATGFCENDNEPSVAYKQGYFLTKYVFFKRDLVLRRCGANWRRSYVCG